MLGTRGQKLFITFIARESADQMRWRLVRSLVVLDVGSWLVVGDGGWLMVSNGSWLVVGNGWLWDDGLLNGWDEGLGNNVLWLGDSFFGNDCVESVDGIGGVVDNAASSISFDQWVLSLNVVSVAGFWLWLSVSGDAIMDVVWEWVLWVWVVVIDALDQSWWLNKGLLENRWLMSISDWLSICDWLLSDDSTTGNGDESAENNELKKVKNTKLVRSWQCESQAKLKLLWMPFLWSFKDEAVILHNWWMNTEWLKTENIVAYIPTSRLATRIAPSRSAISFSPFHVALNNYSWYTFMHCFVSSFAWISRLNDFFYCSSADWKENLQFNADQAHSTGINTRGWLFQFI